MINFQVESPSGSKLSALDYYMLLCLFFLFGSIIEFAINLLISRIIDKKKKVSERILYQPYNKTIERGVTNISMNYIEESKPCNGLSSTNTVWELNDEKVGGLATSLKNKSWKTLRMTTKIDIIGFIAFNSSFLLFNLIYYIIFLK